LPIDLIKVRLQVQVKSSNPQYKGTIHALKTVIGEEGVLSLWKGCSPSLVRQIGYTAVSMTLFQPVRNFLSENQHTPRFRDRFLAGGIAGSIGISIFNPVEVIKVRMQADRNRRHYPNLRNGLKTVIQSEGYLGLWRGILPNIQRAFIVNAAELGSYDQTKQILYTIHPDVFQKDKPITHLFASICAGFFGAVGSNPVDIVKTRLMQQEGSLLVKNPLVAQWQCAYNIIKNEGIMCLYNGFIPNWMRKGPWSIIFFLSYEKYMKLLEKQ